MLLLNKEDIRRVFTMRDAVEADKEAFRIYSTQESLIPLRVNLGISKQEGQTLFMPGYVPDLDSIGVKILSLFPHNREKSLPTITATMVMLDGSTGQVCCILDGTYLTQLRTGAAAGAATDLLARPDARIGALIGTGGQAASQLEALLTVRQLAEVRVHDLDLAGAQSFVQRMEQELNLPEGLLRPVASSAEAVTDADIITAVTTSSVPVFDGSLVKPGAHVNGVGSYMPHMHELDETIISRADKIFFDTREGVLAEAGEFITPIKNGTFSLDRINGEIGQVVAGQLPGRESATEITLFKTVGMAILDIVTAGFIYKKAVAHQIGQEFSF